MKGLTSAVVALLLMLPTALYAQSPWIAPSVSVGVAYDDNVNAESENEQDDMMLRVTPSIEAGFRSARGEWRFLHSFDGEKYKEQTQLDDWRTRHFTELGLDYRMTQRFDVALHASTAMSGVGGDLLPEFGLEQGRRDARRTDVRPSVAYRFTPRTSGTAGLEIARDDLIGGATADTRGAWAGVEHRTTPRDTWTGELIRRDYKFRPGGDAHSNILLVGWVGEISPRTTLLIQGGPRQTEVDTQPEVLLGWMYAIQGGEFAVNYARTERTVLGQSGLAEADMLWATYMHPVSPSLSLRITPSYASLERGDDQSETWRVRVQADYRFTPLISMTSSYQWNKQVGSLDIPGPVEFTRNVVFFGITVAFSPRVGQVPPADIRRRSR